MAVAAVALATAAVLPARAATPADTPGGAPAATTTAPAGAVPREAAPADWPTYLVTVRHGLDPAAVARAYGITPVHVFHSTLNGFAARLSPDQVVALREAPIVESVEEDGTASPAGTAA